MRFSLLYEYLKVAYASFLSFLFEMFILDLKNSSRTIEISYIPAISYPDESNGHRFHLPICHVLVAL